MIMKNESCLENLPNELLIEICYYLKSLDILYSFSYLNSRFQCLINEFCYQYDLSFCTLNEFQRLISSSSLLNLFCLNLRKLILSNEYCPGKIKLFQDLFFNKNFPLLKSLTLNNLTNENIKILSKISYLKELNIEFNSYETLTNENEYLINYNLFEKDNSLEKLTLYIDQGIEIFQKNYFNTLLTDLTIQLIYLDDLLRLFQQLPSLIYLEVDILRNHLSTIIISKKKILLNNLKEFYLHTREKEILPFEQILKPLILNLPSIEYLSFGIRTNDPIYSNGQIWNDLFSSMSNIKTFILGLEIDITINLYYYLNIETIDEINEIVFQSFNNYFPSFPISIYKNNRTLFIDSIPYKFNRHQSYSTIPQANHGFYTNIQLLNEKPKNIVGLSITGDHQSIDMNDYIDIINRFPKIKWIYLDSINITNKNLLEKKIYKLKYLKTLIYMRSTFCKINSLFFHELFSKNEIKTLKIMYGDLIYYLRTSQNRIDGRNIENLVLYVSGADGIVHLIHLNNLIITFPYLKYLTIEVTSKNLIKKNQLQIINYLLKSFQNLQSFQIISRKGNLHFIQNHQFQSQCLENINATNSYLILQPKYFSLWKFNS